MDPSKIYGEEECESSESGWTMYLGSHLDGEKDHQHYSDDDNQHDGRAQGYYNSDDSMVSDASSRPTSTHQRSRPAHNAAAKQEEKAKAKKQSASGAARKYTKAAGEKKAKIKSSKAK